MMKILILVLGAVSILCIGLCAVIIANVIDMTKKWDNIFSNNGRDGF